MSLGSPLDLKEAAATAQPLLLATVTFSDGQIRRSSSHAVTYGGNDYLAEIVNDDAAAASALGEQGIDVPASLNIQYADPAYTLYLNYDWKGARLSLDFIFFDVLTDDYSSSSLNIFKGMCKEPGGKMPSHDGKNLTVGFISRLFLGDQTLPSLTFQKTCIQLYAQTPEARQLAADSRGSISYGCGYSPDATGSNARGNLDGDGNPFHDCDKTSDSCKARGMFDKDSSNRITGRFGGFSYNPPDQTLQVRNYSTGKIIEVSNSNEVSLGDPIPMLWGTAWIDPYTTILSPDGNYVTITSLLFYGEADNILDVTVNDVHIPHTYDDFEFSSVPKGIPNATEASKGGWWKCQNRGDRDGAPQYPGEDPYGSFCVLKITVPHKIAAPGSTPRVRVYASRGSDFPSEQMEDILLNWAGWEPFEIDDDSVNQASDVDHAGIPTQDSGTVNRFHSYLYLRQPESISDILRGLRNCRRGILAPDSTGKLRFGTEQTLADQQPSPIPGSNYNEPIASMHANGTDGVGYAAYRFSEDNILKDPPMVVSRLTTGNKFLFKFQNARNLHSTDALQYTDSEDILRVQQIIPGTFTLRGADNFDLVKRLHATFLAKQLRGNAEGNVGGTHSYEFSITFRGVHLNLGDICILNSEKLQLQDQPVRITKIDPDTDFETARITASWDDDFWYLDIYGQQGIPSRTSRFRDSLLRPSFPWKPNKEQPPAGDSLFDNTDWTFSVAPAYDRGAGQDYVAGIVVTGKQPVNVVSPSLPPPIVPIQGNTANTGGTIHGDRTVYVGFSAKNAAGEYSGLSRLCLLGFPAGTNTNVGTVPGLIWDSLTTGYAVFAGIHSQSMSLQFEASGAPSSVTLTSLSVALTGPPDTEFDSMIVRLKKIWHGGAWGAQVVEVTSNSIRIGVPSPGFTVNEYAGRDLTWLGKIDSQDLQPLANFRVASNTVDTLVFESGAPNPITLGIQPLDVVELRFLPTVGSDGTGTYLEDLANQNSFYPDGMIPGVEVGRLIRIFAGTGAGQPPVRVDSNTQTRLYGKFLVLPDSTSRYIVEDAKWEVIDRTSSLTNADPNAEITMRVNATNYIGQTVLVQVVTLDGSGNENIEAYSPFREIYLFGKGLVWKTVTADYVMDLDDQAIAVNTAAGPVSITLPPIIPGRTRSRSQTIKKVSNDSNPVTILPSPGASIDGAALDLITLPGDSVTYSSDQ